MSNTTSNPRIELDGLRDAIAAATTGVIARAVTVRNRGYDSATWLGPWPLIMLPDFDWRLDRLFGGTVNGGKGQHATRPSYYTVSIEDVIDVRQVTDASTLVAASQSDVISLIEAIRDYFDTPGNECLKDGGGNPRAYKAGEHLRFKMANFRSEDGLEARVVAVGAVSVQGLQS